MNDIVLRLGSQQAMIRPELGCNCYSYVVDGCELMRKPASIDIHREAPNVYGTPLLFPPNRIRGGRFTFEGREYAFPITEPARGHHIHGMLSQTAFEVVEQSDTAVTLLYQATEEKPYMQFPHAFTVTVRWALQEDGLHHRVAVRNDSASRMPVGIGFHTALNANFIPGDTEPTHYRLFMDAVEEITYDPQSIIPTGERRQDTPLLRQLNGDGYQPQGEYLSRHMLRGKGGAQVLHLPTGRRICYEPSDNLRYWVVWNGDGKQDFICPEPQSWMIDAPNQSQDVSESGFRAIEPGETFTVETKLYLK